MSEQVEMTSLFSLASTKGAPARAETADRATGKAGRESRGKGFDGFLKTFLGNDQPTHAGQNAAARNQAANTRGKGEKSGNAKSSSAGAGKAQKNARRDGNAAKAASKLDRKDRRALRQAIEKTVPAGDGVVEVNNEVAAAAEEAAMLIWNILYPDIDAGNLAEATELDTGQGGALSGLAEILAGMQSAGSPDSLAGLGASQLASGAADAAIETANASAEMNSDAVMAALEELLDGMSRETLSEALAKTASALGLSGGKNGDPLSEIAAALGLESITAEGEETAPDAMLGELGRAAAETDMRQKIAPDAAETSGTAGTESEILDWFQLFLEEKFSEGAVSDTISAMDSLSSGVTAGLLHSFASWLADANNSKSMKELTADAATLAKTLADALTQSESAAGTPDENSSAEILSGFKKNLETILHNQAGKISGKGGEAETSGGGQNFASLLGETGKEGGGAFASSLASGSSLPASGVSSQPAPATQETASSMLDRIANIERLADALKMSQRGPVRNLTLMLSPAELGKVMLRVESRDGVVSAYLRVEKSEAAVELTSSLQQLRQNLKAQGIELGELDIRQYSHGQAATDDGGQGRRRNREADADSDQAPQRPGVPGKQADDGIQPVAESRNGAGGLNLFA